MIRFGLLGEAAQMYICTKYHGRWSSIWQPLPIALKFSVKNITPIGDHGGFDPYHFTKKDPPSLPVRNEIAAKQYSAQS